jgi:hypothetical protein
LLVGFASYAKERLTPADLLVVLAPASWPSQNANFEALLSLSLAEDEAQEG